MMTAQLQQQQQQQQQQQPNGPVAPAPTSTQLAAPSSSSINTPRAERVAAPSTHLPHASSELQNRAGESDSPYVRQHADTPVAWQLLDAATLTRATSENKPIFMHIGFLADHHCHLTTQDSFSNPAVASFLNASFIPILVDREERPDLDNIYQNYSEAVNATGGWPLNLFLTPDLYPIFGGTYWPGPGTEHSLANVIPSGENNGGGDGSSGGGGGGSDEETCNDFLAITKKIHGFWVDQEERCRREAFEMLSKLQDFAQEGTFGANITTTTTTTTTASPPQPPNPHDADLDLDQLDEALDRITKMFDPVDFGFGTPKFPNPARLSFLLRLAHFPKEVRDVVGDKDVDNATAMAVGTLRRIRDGGLRDHVGAGAGFMRFSVTSDWSMPHFEKMVGENALLLGVFLDAWLGGAEGEMRLDNEFADVVLELADYLVSPVVRLPAGGFVTSEVADSFYRRGDRHVREGAYYLWTRREFDHVVGGEHDSAIAAAYWNVLEDGNIPRDQDPHDEFINQNVLFIGKDAQELSRQFGIPTTEVRRIVEEAREKLQAHRERERVRPERDEKVVVNTNGTVISALARTAAALGSLEEARSAKYLDAARKVASFVKEHLWVGGVLRRFWYGGKASETRAFADDYAFLIEGLLDLYEATLETEWLDWAGELQDTQTRIFYDSIVVSSDAYPPSPRQAHSGGFYSTELETLSHTILRLKSGMDKSAPSTNAVSASNLFRLGALLDNKAYAVQAKETINAFEAEILQYPWLFVSLLEGVVSEKLGVRKVRVERGDGEGLKAYRRLPRGEARALILVKGEEVKSVEEKLDNLTLQEEGPKEVKAEETTAVDVEGKPEPEVLALPVQKDTKGLDETTLRTEDGQVEPQEQQPKEEEKVLV